MDATMAFRQGLALLDEDYAEELLPAAQQVAARFPGDARIHQLAGLVARTCGESGIALAEFAEAARLAPRDALIAHSHARAALEAGKPAARLFDIAARLAPQDGSVLVGRAAARVQEGDSARAMEELTAIVRQNPLWTDGHSSLAQLRGQLGTDPVAEMRTAITRNPRSPELNYLLANTLLSGRNFTAAEAALADAERQLPGQPWIALLKAHAVSEQGRISAADALFAALPPANGIDAVSLRARHLVRANRAGEAAQLLEPWIARDQDHLLWPYLSLAWRMEGDPRWEWLEGDRNLVGTYDIQDQVAAIPGLAEHLRSLHFASDEPLDQSVRGGTQTDGNLLLRDEEPIRALRALLLETVARHVAALPEPREGHPTLPAQRAPRRISGSWSVRLRDAGFHSDHVHSKGWFSSALYVALPEDMRGEQARAAHHGWLSLGECRDVVPELAPVYLVEPKVGRLALFPSTMWHGTRPFPAGERMTVAFDIAIPKQS
ncbi:MAG: hypothetical protein IE921_09115 [Rhodobacteraceae bacterium]|nr:hypothetical protein [Paracoccaceae bacterium]